MDKTIYSIYKAYIKKVYISKNGLYLMSQKKVVHLK